MARPSSFTPYLAEQICDYLSQTGSIRETATECGVDRKTISRWCQEHLDFAAAIARAKRLGYDNRAEIAVAAAKSATDAQLGRLAFDADRWYLSKIDPQRYGDKLKLSGDLEAPLVQSPFDIRLLNQEQREQLRVILEAAVPRKLIDGDYSEI